MNEAVRVPCANCGLSMLPETGERTGGVCMRCAGEGRDTVVAKQRSSTRPTLKSKKHRSSLTALDLETYPVWLTSPDEDGKIFPLGAGAVPLFGEVIVSTEFEFSDGSTRSGAITVVLTRGGVGYLSPTLLAGNERIDLPDGWPQFESAGVSYSYEAMTESLRERLEREFLQQRARVERVLGKPAQNLWPAKFSLRAVLQGDRVATGVVPVPKFHAPLALGESRAINGDVLKVTRELEVAGGRWIVAIASAYAEPSHLFDAIRAAYRRWSSSSVEKLQRLDVLLLARERDPGQVELMEYLATRWNRARKMESSASVDICLGSRTELWSCLTNTIEEAAVTSPKMRFVCLEPLTVPKRL
jgi:hypothetical protein